MLAYCMINRIIRNIIMIFNLLHLSCFLQDYEENAPSVSSVPRADCNESWDDNGDDSGVDVERMELVLVMDHHFLIFLHIFSITIASMSN